MTDAEKIATIKLLLDTRLNACIQTERTAQLFNRYLPAGEHDVYDRKITAAQAVSTFCFEMLDVINELEKE